MMIVPPFVMQANVGGVSNVATTRSENVSRWYPNMECVQVM